MAFLLDLADIHPAGSTGKATLILAERALNWDRLFLVLWASIFSLAWQKSYLFAYRKCAFKQSCAWKGKRFLSRGEKTAFAVQHLCWSLLICTWNNIEHEITFCLEQSCAKVPDCGLRAVGDLACSCSHCRSLWLQLAHTPVQAETSSGPSVGRSGHLQPCKDGNSPWTQRLADRCMPGLHTYSFSSIEESVAFCNPCIRTSVQQDL